MIFMNHMLKINHIITINNVNNSSSCQNYPIERKCVTSGKIQYIHILFIYSVLMMTVVTHNINESKGCDSVQSGQRGGEEDGTDSLHLGLG